MKKLTSVLFSVLILMVVIVPNSVSASQSSWVYSDEMTSSRAAFGVATVNGNIYLIGGQNSSALNKVEVYNSNTKKWTTKASMTTARAAFGTAVVNGKIYTIGGYSGDAVNLSGGSHLSTVEEYDPINDVWTTKASLPVARSWTNAVAYNGKIYVFGGLTASSNATNLLDIYDTTNDTWSSETMPMALHSPSSVVANDKIYLIGGDTGYHQQNTFWEYDPTTNTWDQKLSMNTPRDSLSTIYSGGKIYAIGGISGGSITNVVEQYDFKTDTWTTGPNLNLPRWGSEAALVGGKITVFGGGTTFSNFTLTSETLTVNETPASPFHLVATPGDSMNKLTWESVTGSTSYTVKRSTSPGGPYTDIISVTDNSYIDNSVTNGTTYYYVITATNTAGESTNSNEASATPRGPIEQPETGRAILVVTLNTGLEKEFDLSMEEVNSFISWYEARAAGTGTASFTIDKHDNNKGPFKSRKDYVIFDKILTFEVNEYEVAE